MRADLVVPICVDVAAANEAEDAREEGADGDHDQSSSRRFIIATVRSQSAVSVASCFRPVRVIA